MGLDIFHYKVTKDKPKLIYPGYEYIITEDNYELFDVDISYFEPNIEIIDSPTVLHTLVFPKKEEYIDDIKKITDKNVTILFEENLNDVNKAVFDFTNKNKYKETKLKEWNNNEWLSFDIYIIEKKKGFYYEEVGYQRKGMNLKFWKKFCEKDIYCYTQKEDFEYALNCVDYCWHTDTDDIVNERIELFKNDFLDKYESHKSWLEVSY